MTPQSLDAYGQVSTIVQGFCTVAICIATIYTARLSKRMAEANKVMAEANKRMADEAEEMRLSRLEPSIHVSIEPNPDFNSMGILIISNYGAGVARQIKLNVDPALTLGYQLLKEYSVFRTGLPFLGPGTSFRLFWPLGDHSPHVTNISQFEIECTYSDALGRPYVTKSFIDNRILSEGVPYKREQSNEPDLSLHILESLSEIVNATYAVSTQVANIAKRESKISPKGSNCPQTQLNGRAEK